MGTMAVTIEHARDNSDLVFNADSLEIVSAVEKRGGFCVAGYEQDPEDT